jgi:hypothetical protein
VPKKKFALERGGPQRLELAWSGIWKKMSVTLDGRTLGTIATQAELKAGRDFELDEGGTLRVQLQTGLSAELQVTKDGVALPGSGSDPVERFKAAWGIIFFIAGLNGLLGLVVLIFDVAVLRNLGLGMSSLITGVIYLGLGLWVKSQRSAIGLGIALALFSLDGLLSLGMSVSEGGSPAVGGIIARIFLLLPMARGFAAIKELKLVTAPGLAVPEGAPSDGGPWQPPRKD